MVNCRLVFILLFATDPVTPVIGFVFAFATDPVVCCELCCLLAFDCTFYFRGLFCDGSRRWHHDLIRDGSRRLLFVRIWLDFLLSWSLLRRTPSSAVCQHLVWFLAFVISFATDPAVCYLLVFGCIFYFLDLFCDGSRRLVSWSLLRRIPSPVVC